MPKDWEKFKLPFRANAQKESTTRLTLSIAQDTETLRVLTEKLEVYKEQLKELEASGATELGLLPEMIRVLELDLPRRETELTAQKAELIYSEVMESVVAMQTLDDQALEELTTEETGELALKQGELEGLTRLQDTAERRATEATEEVANQEGLLNALLTLSFSEIKGLVQTMEEAQRQTKAAKELLEKGQKELVLQQALYDNQSKLLEQLETNRELLREATTIVENNRALSKQLSEKRQEVETLLEDYQSKKRALDEATTAVEDAVKEEVEKDAPTSSPGKENHQQLLLVWKAVLEARAQLERAVEEKLEATRKTGEKKVELKELQDRARMLAARGEVLELGAELSKLLNGTKALRDLVVWKESASVLQETMGEGPYDAFAKKGLAFMQGLDGLIALGMKDEEVVTIYQQLKWPEKWHPPRMRPQEANWLKVKGSLKDDKIALQQQQMSRLTLALGFAEQNQETVLSNFGQGMESIGLVDKRHEGPVTQWMTLVSSVITLGTAGARAVSTTRSLMQTDDSVDPVEQLMLIDETLANIGATAGGIIKTAQSAIDVSKARQIAALVPGLGALSTFGSMCFNASAATQYWVAAQADGEVHRKAKETEHRLEAPTDHVTKRGKQVASRRTAQAASDLIAFCGHICTLSNIAAPVGVTLGTLSTVVSTSEKAISWAVDATQMNKARALLKKAQGGDPEARAEIFREHPYYATAIIALLAEEGDTIALAIYGNHKVTKDMVVRSSAKVLQKYLLRELVEEETTTSWSEIGEWFVGAGETIGSGLSQGLESLELLYDSITILSKSTMDPQKRANAELAFARRKAVPVGQLQAAITKHSEAQKTLEQQQEALTKLSPGTEKEQATLLVETWKKQVAALLEEVNKLYQKVEDQMDAGLKAVNTLGTDITEAGLKRFQELVGIQRQCMRIMSPLL
ncbi:MAG: hypothetical protein H6741_06190 [Alphaproteobacteria bacterium]|nr:hypothetical protein [Alphaproteobacteria bacterium]MCB9792299.1 hypothetical protein [Alphaproteobacteria bacterium]